MVCECVWFWHLRPSVTNRLIYSPGQENHNNSSLVFRQPGAYIPATFSVHQVSPPLPYDKLVFLLDVSPVMAQVRDLPGVP